MQAAFQVENKGQISCAMLLCLAFSRITEAVLLYHEKRTKKMKRPFGCIIVERAQLADTRNTI